MKRLFLSSLLVIFLTGCATIPTRIAKDDCDRKVYNPRTGEFDKFICLGETIAWDGTNFRVLAEAMHPETKALIMFFDFTGDCEIDNAGIYSFDDGIYYLSGVFDPQEAFEIIRRTEAATGLKILKRVPCLKK